MLQGSQSHLRSPWEDNVEEARLHVLMAVASEQQGARRASVAAGCSVVLVIGSGAAAAAVSDALHQSFPGVVTCMSVSHSWVLTSCAEVATAIVLVGSR